MLITDGVAIGDKSALESAAFLKLNGLGEPEDFRAGIELLRRAAAAGDHYSRFVLAAIEIEADQNAPLSDTDVRVAEYLYKNSMPVAPQNHTPHGNPPQVEVVHFDFAAGS